MMNRWSRALGQVYEALAWMACAMLFALMLVICADVFLRNVPLIPGLRGMPATNDLSEAFLYLITLFAGHQTGRRAVTHFAKNRLRCRLGCGGQVQPGTWRQAA